MTQNGIPKSSGNSTMVECYFDGALIQIPDDIFFSGLMGKPILNKKFVRYKEGAKMYSISEREFYTLVHDANAVYKRNKMALVNLEIFDKYMGFFHVE